VSPVHRGLLGERVKDVERIGITGVARMSP
jgi:hypothetical protein